MVTISLCLGFVSRYEIIAILTQKRGQARRAKPPSAPSERRERQIAVQSTVPCAREETWLSSASRPAVCSVQARNAKQSAENPQGPGFERHDVGWGRSKPVWLHELSAVRDIPPRRRCNPITTKTSIATSLKGLFNAPTQPGLVR